MISTVILYERWICFQEQQAWKRSFYSYKCTLSSIVLLGLWRYLQKNLLENIHGRKEFVWRCVTKIEQGSEICKNRTVKEDELYGAIITAINKLLVGGNNMIKTLEENIHAVIGESTEYQIWEINTLKTEQLIKRMRLMSYETR